jgi:hypothetical protein
MIAQKLSAEQLETFEKMQRAATQYDSHSQNTNEEKQKPPTQA